MRLFLLTATALATAVSVSACRAQTTPVVLELFTSQGCSSCPPADALMTRFSTVEGVIALALHVDYWDYLGWTDSFGKPEHTRRQQAYAKAVHSRTIYTPQMIIQGDDRVKGHDADSILAEIAEEQAKAPEATLALERDGDSLTIDIAPTEGAVGPADIHLVNFIPSQDVTIEGGENAGQQVIYTNIVTNWRTIGRWDGKAPVEMRFEGAGDGSVAVIVQQLKMGPILTAGELP